MEEKSVLQVLVEHTIKVSKSSGFDITTCQKQIAISIQKELDLFKQLEAYNFTYYRAAHRI